MELVDFANALELPIISAGKGKNNPLKFDAVPADYEEEAFARNMNPRMLVEFVDGSKTMVEMAALANATGLVPDVPGMHGPEATIDTLEDILIPQEDGGILSAPGRVDYTIGKGVAPGVFVVVKAPHERIHERMADLKSGAGHISRFIARSTSPAWKCRSPVPESRFTASQIWCRWISRWLMCVRWRKKRHAAR